MKRLLLSLLFTLFASQVSLAQSPPPTPSSGETLECLSRSCLLQLMDRYLAALVAHEPARLPFAQGARFVENADSKPIGEGFWRSASKVPDSFAIYVPDPVSRSVGLLAMMEENGQPVMVALRIQTEHGQIIEAEHLLARSLRESSLANLQSPRPGLLSEIPASQRLPRWELIGLGYSYYDALELDDGQLSPMAPDCERHENGMITVAPIPAVPPERPDFRLMGCQDQLSTGVMSYIDALDNRRVELADPVTGLVMGFSHFRHAMTRTVFAITGVPGITEREIPFNKPFDLPAAHVFKVGADGWIHEIEAMGFIAPYMSSTGWE